MSQTFESETPAIAGVPTEMVPGVDYAGPLDGGPLREPTVYREDDNQGSDDGPGVGRERSMFYTNNQENPEQREDVHSDYGDDYSYYEPGVDDDEDLTGGIFDPELALRVDRALLPKPSMDFVEAAVTVPPFDPTASKVRLRELVSEFTMSDDDLRTRLRAAGYPDFMVNMLIASRASGHAETRLRELKQIQSRSKPKESVDVYADKQKVRKFAGPAYVAMGKGGGFAAPEYWRIPIKKNAPLISRPTIGPKGEFSVLQYKAWIDGVAAALARHIKSKKQFVTADDFVRTVYKGAYRGSKSFLREQLLKSHVYIAEYKQEHMSTSPYVLSIGLKMRDAPKSLTIAGHEVTTLEELATLEGLFMKHKPLFRFSVKYLSGEMTEGHEIEKLKTALEARLSVTLQGNIPVHATADVSGDVRVEHTHHHDIAFPTARAVVNEACAAVGIESDERKRGVLRFVAFLVSITKTSDWIGFLACCAQFMLGSEYWYAQLCEKFADVTSALTMQDGDSWLDKPLSYFKDLPSFSDAFSVFVAGFMEYVVLPTVGAVAALRPSLFAVINETRLAITRDLALNLGRSIVMCITEVIQRLRSCVATKSFSPLWGDQWDPRRWVRYADSYVTHFPVLTATMADPSCLERIKLLRENGELPMFFTTPITLSEYVVVLKNHSSSCHELMKQFRNYVEVVRELGAVQKRLNDFIQTLQITVNSSSQRMAPFMLLLYGPPGGGKTNLAKMMAKAIAVKNGFDLSPTGFYDWQEGVNFQDNLSHVQWCIHMDDVDQGTAKDAPGVRNFVQNVLAVVNNAPLPVEAAAVDLKGKIHAAPRLLTYCSNFDGANLVGHTLQPAAFWRRVGLRVYVTAKDEFSKGSGVLDPAKIAGTSTYELYNLEVSEFVPQDVVNVGEIPFSTPKSITLAALMELLHKRFSQHQAEQLKRLSALVQKNHCGVCGLPVGEQLCSHMKAVVEPEPVAPVVSKLQGQVIGKCKRKVGKYFEDEVINAVRRIDVLMSSIVVAMLVDLASKITLVVGAVVLLRHIFGYFQGRTGNAVDNLFPKEWVRLDQTYKPGIPPSGAGVTYTYDELLMSLSHNQVVVSGDLEGFGLIVSENCVLFPSHFTKKGGLVTVSAPGKTFQVQVNDLNSTYLSNRHLMLLRCGELKGLPSILKKVWVDDDLMINSFDEVQIIKLGKKIAGSNVNARSNLPDGMCWQVDVETRNGDCGCAYIGRLNNSWRVIGMHYQWLGELTKGSALGGVITRLELERGITLIGGVFQGVETVMHQVSQTPELQEFSKFPLKSEVWVAMSNGSQVYPFGELYPPLKGSTVKTKMSPSLICDDVADLEEEFCGLRGFWKFPEFRGRMVDGVWSSPYTNAFTAENKGRFDEYTMWCATLDYISGMEDLLCDGWSQLSENQVVVGVPGSYIHGMNLQTSAGPPFNRSKRNYMAVVDREAIVDPAVLKVYDELERVLAEGIPAAFGLCTLKDEPVRPEKKPRVFTCLGVSYNMLLKKHLAAVKAFIRANFAFFESAVGIDMTSADAERVVRHLQSLDPSLTSLYDGDVRMLDKAYAGGFYYYIAIVVYSISFVLGLDAPAALRLVLGVKHARLCIKGDVFSAFWNPSGHDATVEFNGILMSILERYVFYRANPVDLSRDRLRTYIQNIWSKPLAPSEFQEKFTFRRNVALVTYGDDNVKAMRIPPADNYCAVWLDELGMEMTDATKAKQMLVKTIAEVQFLKRRFVWDEKVQRHLTPLDMRSLMRTLVIKKESILSTRDHACVAMTEVLRELVYHGEVAYNRFLTRFESLADKYALRGNSYLSFRPYTEWYADILSGSFCAWVPRSPITKL